MAPRRDWAAAILPDSLEKQYWQKQLENPKTQFEALRYLSDQKHGRAPQSVAINHTDSTGLGLGNLPIAREFEPRATNKPN